MSVFNIFPKLSITHAKHDVGFQQVLICFFFFFKAGLDYIAVNKVLNFAPGVTMQTVRIIILDDLGRPIVEGSESFELVLRMPMDAMLGEPSKALVTINDTETDSELSFITSVQ